MPEQEIRWKGYTAEVVKGPGTNGALEIIASTGSLDRERDRLDPTGARLEHYLRNPTVLWAHDHGTPPIGKATRVWPRGNQLRATIEFAPTGFAQEIKGLYEGGYLNAFSVGFLPTKARPNGDGGIDFMEWDLLEISAVPVPAQPEALVAGKAMARLWNAARRPDPLDPAIADFHASAAEQWLAEALDEWKMASADPATTFLSLSPGKKREVVRNAIWPAFAQAWVAATGRLPG